MSRWIAAVVLLGVLGSASAAPREKGPSADALAAGERFARELGVIVQSISREYVRPVSAGELYSAAVKAVYDEARRPEPTGLIRDLKAAKGEHEQFDLVKRARAAVHGAPELEDGRDLLVGVRSLTTVLDPHSILIPSGVLNGTTTGNTYGFEFDGEAQALPARGHSNRRDAQPWVADGGGPTGVPPVPLRVLHVKPGTPAQLTLFPPAGPPVAVEAIVWRADADGPAFFFIGVGHNGLPELLGSSERVLADG